MDLPPKNVPVVQDHGSRCKAQAHLRFNAGNPAAFDNQVGHGLLKQGQIGLIFQRRSYRLLVKADDPPGRGLPGLPGLCWRSGCETECRRGQWPGP